MFFSSDSKSLMLYLKVRSDKLIKNVSYYKHRGISWTLCEEKMYEESIDQAKKQIMHLFEQFLATKD